MRDLVGKIYNSLLVEKLSHMNGNYQYYWKVLCKKCKKHNVVREDLIVSNKGTCSNSLCNGNIDNIRGKFFKNLKVIKLAYVKNKRSYWVCKCLKCKINTKPLSATSIKTRVGCTNIMCNNKVESIIGNRYGFLVVEKFSHMGKNKASYWICRCLLCNSETSPKRADILKTGNVRSCGCSTKISEHLFKNILTEVLPNFKIVQGFRGFDWLRNPKTNYPLELDFYIPELKLAIEYDGKHHFCPVRFGGMDKKEANRRFINQKYLDKVKNKKISQHPEDIKYFIRFRYSDKISKKLIISKFKQNNIIF